MFPYIPKELVIIILAYEGHIKYRKGAYVNIIHKHDTRYSILGPLIQKKREIMKKMERRQTTNGFYFEVLFDKLPHATLCYDYAFSYSENTFEICYVELKKNSIKQIRTYI